jgi:hypothetical protein
VNWQEEKKKKKKKNEEEETQTKLDRTHEKYWNWQESICYGGMGVNI